MSHLFTYDFIVSFDVNFLWVWGIILFPTEDDSGFGCFVDVLLLGASNFLVCSEGSPILSHFSPEIIILFLNSLIDVVVELFCLCHTISSSCTVCWFKSKIRYALILNALFSIRTMSEVANEMIQLSASFLNLIQFKPVWILLKSGLSYMFLVKFGFVALLFLDHKRFWDLPTSWD